MRRSFFLLIVVLLMVSGPLAAAVQEKQQASYKGLWISTPFPSISIPAGEPITVDLKVHNAGLPPQRVALRVEGVPDKWQAVFIGAGRPVAAAFVAPDSDTDVTLRLIPPQDLASGKFQMKLAAVGDADRFVLPLELNLGEVLPSKLTLDTALPALKGSPDSSFEYEVDLKNESGREALAKLEAAAPPGFKVSIKERYGSKELTSVPIKAGEKRELKVTVDPPDLVEAGTYKVALRAVTGQTNAKTDLTLDVSGRAEISLKGKNELLSGEARAGEETSVALVVENGGTAPATNIELSSSEPSGWKLAFSPKSIDALPPGERREVKALITPSPEAIAGDYMVTLRASGEGVSKSTDYRVTVRTSTVWGVVGVLVIAAALVVLVVAVIRFGRR